MRCLAILVNYHCANLLVDAVRSIANDPACDRIHVVDNSEDAAEAACLGAQLPSHVKLTISERNLGFGAACNSAFADDDSDCILLLNPDARLLPGALARLKETLAGNQKLGGVGPRIYWDDECRFLLPPTTFPSAVNHFMDLLEPYATTLQDWRARCFRQRALFEWRTTQPVRVQALSGGHVLLKRTAVEAAGGLFDPRFFMYWEDSDLMCRLTHAGFELRLEPRAHAIHHYEHSPSKDRLIGQGWPIYASKHFAGWGWQLLEKWLQKLPTPTPTQRPAPQVLSQTQNQDVEIDVPLSHQSGWLLEYSPAASFVPSVGLIGTGSVARLPAQLRARFSGRDFYVRLGAVTGNVISGCYVLRDSAQSP